MKFINLDVDPTGKWDDLTLALFETKYKHMYEVQSRNLDGVFTEYHNVDGASFALPTMGAIVMADRGDYASILPTLKPDLGRVVINLRTKGGRTPIDIVLQKELIANVITPVAEELAGSIKRMEDQFVLDALMDKDDMAKMVNAAKPFGVEGLIQAKLQLDVMGVPASDRHIVAFAGLQEPLLNDAKATKSDYVGTINSLVRGEIKEFANFRFHWIPNMPEGGLEAVKGKVAYAFRKSDGAQVWGLGSQIQRSYKDDIISNVLTMVLHGGAKVLAPNHVVLIKTA
jgi:hypothetical protein